MRRWRVDPGRVSRAKSILVAYDGSENGCRVLDAAAELMGYGSTLAVVGGAPTLAAASRHLSGRHLFARYIDGDGPPSETVLETAADVAADVIVVDAKSGSMETVVRCAPCDVLVVR